VRPADLDHSKGQAPAATAVMERLDAQTAPAAVAPTGTVAALRALALRGLERMYDQQAGRFVFRVRKSAEGVVREGLSDRYTAMTALGLAGEQPDTVRHILAGDTIRALIERLIDRVDTMQNIGDVSLIAWAGHVAGCATDRAWERVLALDPVGRPYPTVDVAWTLSAAAADHSAKIGTLGERLALRLQSVFTKEGLFPHQVGDDGASSQRSHVSCFADLVYPTLALAQFGSATGDAASVRSAARCAETMCRLQGPAGQWWWHFDYRTGRVLEGYPVYAVHQDAMAPMALLAAAAAARTNYDHAIARGLDWLWSAPEIDGRSLVDGDADLIWRKVARREPAKLSRYVQAAVSRVSPRLRAPGLDPIFPPTAIDYEDRPYHLGWLLYAWPAERAARFPPARTTR
jgi:hypothetical protein